MILLLTRPPPELNPSRTSGSTCARTGYWIPTSIVGCTTLGTLLLTWNWGQNDVTAYENFRHVWKEEVSDPIKLDLKSVAQAYSVVLKGPTPSAWEMEGTRPPIGRGRAALEGLFASLSLLEMKQIGVGLTVSVPDV